MKVIPLLNIAMILMFTVGFRPIPERWDISVEEPTLWLELDEEFYAEDGFGDKVAQLDGMLASVKDVPAAEQRAEIWRIILENYASVETSFLKLRLKPGQIPSIDALYDEEYDEETAKNRTIKVKVASSQGLASGHASRTINGSHISDCTVVLAPRTLKDPEFYAHVLSHEILHCLGLLHQQEDCNSLMSYSNNATGLGIEERMGLTHLYPLDPDYAKETPSFGLSCEPMK